MNKIEQIKKLNEEELRHGVKPEGSWHNDYKSKWIYIGNLREHITNDDLIVLLSQYGEPVHVDREAKKPFGFVKYKDENSCVLAIDNFNGIEYKDSFLYLDHAKDRKLTGNPLFSMNKYDMATCDKFISILNEHGGNCCPELFAYRDYIEGVVEEDPLVVKIHKTKKRKVKEEEPKKKKKKNKKLFKEKK